MEELKPCSYCGKLGCYARNLCRNCYTRQLRNGSPQYLDRHAPRPERRKEATDLILEKYKAGEKQSDIAREFGLSRQRINEIVHRYIARKNSDRIRAMPDEELADMFEDYGDCPPIACPHDGEGARITRSDCTKCWLKWLRQEVG